MLLLPLSKNVDPAGVRRKPPRAKLLISTWAVRLRVPAFVTGAHFIYSVCSSAGWWQVERLMAASNSNPVRIVPLGGLGEIGLNLLVIECGQSAVVIDAGVMFPEERAFGGGLLIP